jgi:polyhydroxyalkanoate synthesis repressor PhaR
MAKDIRIIKKYGDRRLYDTAGKSYVKLEEIARMIRDGAEVEVRDVRTGEDLTRIVLTQIVMEDARDREGGLPTHLLHQLVMASDRATRDFLAWYLNSALDLLRKAGHGVQHGLSDAQRAVGSPLQFVRGILPGAAEQPPTPDEVGELRRRVEELEARLAELSRPAKATRRTRAVKASRAQ